jgi:hypothetical protein
MKRLLLIPAAIAVLAVLATPAGAATSTVSGTVSAGTLSLTTSATPTFSLTLDGTDQTASYTVPATVTDATGSGAGWNLTITSTQFTTGGGTPQTLAATASQITSVSNGCVGGSTCTNPTNALTYPITVPAAATAPTAVKYFNAAATTGRGKFTNTPTIGVTVPANAAAGSYTSTLTLAAVSGP